MESPLSPPDSADSSYVSDRIGYSFSESRDSNIASVHATSTPYNRSPRMSRSHLRGKDDQPP